MRTVLTLPPVVEIAVAPRDPENRTHGVCRIDND